MTATTPRRRELQHAIYFTRAGLPLVYTDGNYQAETLSQSGGAFPRHANTSFLGQFGDNRLPNLMQLHQNFARGFQIAARSSSYNPSANDFYTLNSPDLVAYDRVDLRTGASNDAAGVVALVMVNDNFANEVGENITHPFSSRLLPPAIRARRGRERLFAGRPLHHRGAMPGTTAAAWSPAA